MGAEAFAASSELALDADSIFRRQMASSKGASIIHVAVAVNDNGALMKENSRERT